MCSYVVCVPVRASPIRFSLSRLPFTVGKRDLTPTPLRCSMGHGACRDMPFWVTGKTRPVKSCRDVHLCTAVQGPRGFAKTDAPVQLRNRGESAMRGRPLGMARVLRGALSLSRLAGLPPVSSPLCVECVLTPLKESSAPRRRPALLGEWVVHRGSS